MATMTVLPRSRPFTATDLEQMPEDGNLYVLLRAACPAPVEVMLAPLDVKVSELTVMQPDLLVATREALGGRTMVGVPLLAVEVLSPSTRLIDLELKRAAYEAAGTESYWVVDPTVPAITVWRRAGERYDRVAHVMGDETFAAEAPYALDVIPSSLTR